MPTVAPRKYLDSGSFFDLLGAYGEGDGAGGDASPGAAAPGLPPTHLRLRAASPYPPLTPCDTPGESPHRRRRRPSPPHLRSRHSIPLAGEARAAVLQSRPSPSRPRASRLSPTSPCASSSAAAPSAWGGARAAVRHGRGPAGHTRRRGPGLPRARGCTSDVARRDAPENRRCPPRTRLCLGEDPHLLFRLITK